MSIGAVTQAVDFSEKELALVFGENLDLGGDDHGARNGVGKTSILNAISYALYGQALSNIRKENLINRTNGKNMLVTIEFECGDKNYKIERGRKPNLLRFYIDNVAHEDIQNGENNSLGDSRETQQEIDKLLGMSHDMFKHIVALNTYTQPFLSMGANDQRQIIEQLLGITLLSEKAEKLKEQIRTTKDAISTEQIRIQAASDANKRIQDQINNLKTRQKLWTKKKAEDVESFIAALEELAHLDVDNELVQHRLLDEYEQVNEKLTILQTKIKKLSGDQARDSKNVTQIQKDITTLESHTCHSCGQTLHDEKFKEMLVEKQLQLSTAKTALIKIENELDSAGAEKLSIGKLGKKPVVFYRDIKDAYEHQNKLSLLAQQLDQRESEKDPYDEQIIDMETSALQEINFDTVNELNRLQDHQEFLLKLLTNKDSFIRKKIIDQNLSFLNTRLAYYLTKIGLPHTVVFQNDLTVNISELGRDLDFHNLSRGEMTRLILSLSWSFRDVWENLYQKINLIFIDELIDLGIDPAGVESTLAILKKMSRDDHRNIWLVSHKEELCGRVTDVFKVTKENGFTTMAGFEN